MSDKEQKPHVYVLYLRAFAAERGRALTDAVQYNDEVRTVAVTLGVHDGSISDKHPRTLAEFKKAMATMCGETTEQTDETSRH